MRVSYALVAAAVALAPVAASADTLTYNDTPIATYFFGNNTNYSPANSAVLTDTSAAGTDQLFARAHLRFPQSSFAPASNGDTYSFALGTGAPSFDYGVTSAAGLRGLSGLITITNLLTGTSASYDPFALGDNAIQGNTLENSENLSFGFLSGVGFNQNVDNTYRFTFDVAGLASGSKSLTIYAQYGTGAVPEPATWAMMIMGFGLVGAAMRRRRTSVAFA